jgi:hypothetical protein
MIFILLLQRTRIGMNILRGETLKRKCVVYICTLTRAEEERMTLH